MRVAIFDFDGTLYEKETFQVMMNHLKKHPDYHTRYSGFFRWVLPRFIGYKVKLYPEHRMKEGSMQSYLTALRNLSKDEIDAYLKEIANKMRDDFNPEVLEKLKQHIEEDVYVMLVSGAFTPLVQFATEDLNFDEVIGTDIPYNDKVVDHTIPVNHVNGIRKNKKNEEVLHGKQIDWDNSYAYADSYSDLSVLELVGNPVAVQPEQRLLTIAKQRNWDVI